jgi:hypothetical protein
MKEDRFYFPHDYHSRSDRKLVNLQMKYGMEGVGVFWCLVEMLYENGGLLPLEYERITFELRTTESVLRGVVEEFNLFQIKDGKFYSDAVLVRLLERKAKSESARKSISKRWDKYERNTNVIQPNVSRNTIKESKVKERYISNKGIERGETSI